MNDTATAEPKMSKSIVPAERRAALIGARDFAGHMLESAALTRGVGAKPAVEAVAAVAEVKDEDGNVIQEAVAEVKGKAATKGKDVWDLDKMFLLAERNHIDTTSKTFVGLRTTGNIGRARMTIGNMLRAAAKKRWGLFDVEGNWVDAPEEARCPDAPTHNRDGSKIAKVKAAETSADNSDGADADADADSETANAEQ